MYYRRSNKVDVLVYIEEFDKNGKFVLFDFIDSNMLNLFTNYGNLSYNLSRPSMVLLKNYNLKTIQENTIYTIKKEIIDGWRNLNLINIEDNSFLIGYNIELLKNKLEIFSEPVSLRSSQKYIIKGNGNSVNKIPKLKNKLSVTIRDVGQGNWNEIKSNDEIKLVYDAGGPINASKNDIIRIIGNRNTIYSKTKPGLILSHWDKDHYHSLIGMNNKELSNFSYFVCRDYIPNLTSITLFNRIRSAVGITNTITISSIVKATKRSPTHLIPITPVSSPVVIFNSEQHKNRNISGIVLLVKTKQSSIVLPGDCHYEQISRDILPKINYSNQHYLVVPHHGGKAGPYIYNLPRFLSPDKAIISVGTNNHGHPKRQYIRALELNRFNVMQTQKLNKDITINL